MVEPSRSRSTRGLETVVTITLAAREGSTEVTLHHAVVPDDEMGREHKTPDGCNV